MSNEVITRSSEWMSHIVSHLNRMVEKGILLPDELSEILANLSVSPDTALDRKSTRLNSSHSGESRMPSSA